MQTKFQFKLKYANRDLIDFVRIWYESHACGGLYVCVWIFQWILQVKASEINKKREELSFDKVIYAERETQVMRYSYASMKMPDACR